MLNLPAQVRENYAHTVCSNEIKNNMSGLQVPEVRTQIVGEI